MSYYDRHNKTSIVYCYLTARDTLKHTSPMSKIHLETMIFFGKTRLTVY